MDTKGTAGRLCRAPCPHGPYHLVNPSQTPTLLNLDLNDYNLVCRALKQLLLTTCAEHVNSLQLSPTSLHLSSSFDCCALLFVLFEARKGCDLSHCLEPHQTP